MFYTFQTKDPLWTTENNTDKEIRSFDASFMLQMHRKIFKQTVETHKTPRFPIKP